MHLQLRKLRLLWRRREKRWTCNPKLSHIYLTNVAEERSPRPSRKYQASGKHPKASGPLEVRSSATWMYRRILLCFPWHVRSPSAQPWKAGVLGICYGISSLYLIFPRSLTIICSSKLTCRQISKSHPSIVFLTQRSLYVLQFSNVASMRRMQKDQLVLWPLLWHLFSTSLLVMASLTFFDLLAVLILILPLQRLPFHLLWTICSWERPVALALICQLLNSAPRSAFSHLFWRSLRKMPMIMHAIFASLHLTT